MVTSLKISFLLLFLIDVYVSILREGRGPGSQRSLPFTALQVQWFIKVKQQLTTSFSVGFEPRYQFDLAYVVSQASWHGLVVSVLDSGGRRIHGMPWPHSIAY